MTHFAGFDQYGSETPVLPVLISVPHAGRRYPAPVAGLVRLGMAELLPLEDRYADLLADTAIAHGVQALIARVPRLWIDLNRDVREYDPAMLNGAIDPPPMMTAKVRGGLGLIPRKIARGGEIWRTKLGAEDVAERIASLHRPYHVRLDAMLKATHARFGVAVLIDIHSMPPLVDRTGEGAPQIVIGDRFGKSADGRFTACALALVEGRGIAASVNSPYAGGHILERHGAPGKGIHALQLEVDRRLYLDFTLAREGAGLRAMQLLICELIEVLCDEARRPSYAIAAE